MTDREIFNAAMDAGDWPLAAMTILANRQSTRFTNALVDDIWRIAFFGELPDDTETLLDRSWRLIRAMEAAR